MFACVAILAGLLIGVAAGLGMPQNLLIGAVLSPFLLILIYARPYWSVAVYVVLVYADLLSILVRYHNFPPLARFAGAVMLSAVIGYRLVFRREGLRADRVTVWLLAYGAVVALGLFYARDAGLVMTDVIEFVRNFLTYLIIVNALTTTSRLKITLWSILAMGTLLALLAIYQTVTGRTDTDFGGLAQYRVSEITSDTDAARPGGTIGDANYFGQSLLILVPIGFYFALTARRLFARFAGLFAALVLIGGIVFTYSRGDALALAAMLAAGLIYKRPKPVFLVGLVVVALVAVSFLPANYVARLGTIIGTATGGQQAALTEASIRGRAGAVEAAIGMFADHPILGVGRENYPLYQLQYLEGSALATHAKAIPPHDLYLEIATEQGIVGMVVFAGLVLVVYGAVVEARRRFTALHAPREAELASWLGIGLFGYLVSSLFLHGAFLYMLWLQVALIVALRQISRSQEVEPVYEQPPSPETVAPVLPFANNSAPRAYLVPAGLSGPSMLSRLRSAHPGRQVQPPRADAPQVTSMPPALITLDELFRRYWHANGGEAVFGQALSVVFNEAEKTGGESVPVQYYEYSRFEYRPQSETEGAQAGITLGKLGLEVPVMGMPAGALPDGLRGMVRVREGAPVGQIMPAAFYNVWQVSGAETVQGHAISPVLVETLPNGAIIYVQYFERARFEYHPNQAGTVEIQRTPLGTWLFTARYGGES